MLSPRLPPETWAKIRYLWESDRRNGYTWIVREMGLSVTDKAIINRARREGWKKHEFKNLVEKAQKAADNIRPTNLVFVDIEGEVISRQEAMGEEVVTTGNLNRLKKTATRKRKKNVSLKQEVKLLLEGEICESDEKKEGNKAEKVISNKKPKKPIRKTNDKVVLLDSVSGDSVALRAGILAMQREEWAEHARIFSLQAIIESEDMSLVRVGLMAANMVNIRQEGQRKCWGLDMVMADEQLDETVNSALDEIYEKAMQKSLDMKAKALEKAKELGA